MIIFKDLTIQTRSDKPNSDWTNLAKYVVDDNSYLANKIINECPYGFTPVEDGEGNLIDVTPNEQPIEQLKQAKILQTKSLEKDFLASVKLPSKAHNNTLGYYSVTSEKQSLLMGNFFAYQLEKTLNPEAKLTWNESGKSCETCGEWTEEEVTKLMLEIKGFVKPVVSYQQHLEEQINACETVAEVEGIVIDYEQFKTW